MPLLIDPTNPADPLLLWFQDDGRACPKYSESHDLFHQRAKVTIDILNLDDIKIVEERKKLWNYCLEIINRGDKAFAQYQRGSPAARVQFETVIRQIREIIQPSAEFSATARACFSGSAQEWVREAVYSF